MQAHINDGNRNNQCQTTVNVSHIVFSCDGHIVNVCCYVWNHYTNSRFISSKHARTFSRFNSWHTISVVIIVSHIWSSYVGKWLQRHSRCCTCCTNGSYQGMYLSRYDALNTLKVGSSQGVLHRTYKDRPTKWNTLWYHVSSIIVSSVNGHWLHITKQKHNISNNHFMKMNITNPKITRTNIKYHKP